VSLPLEQLTRAVVDQFVAAAIWYLLFGVKLSVEQAATVAQWGAGGLAGYFVFPRMIHRIAFNLLLRKVTKLRKDTLAVFRAQGLGALAADLNGQLGPHMRPSTLAYVDELMCMRHEEERTPPARSMRAIPSRSAHTCTACA
jgi:hypothetical protein